MTTRHLALTIGIMLTGGIAIACIPATSTPGQSSADVTRKASVRVSARDAGVVFYDKAKKGYNQTVTDYYTDSELGVEVRNAAITFGPAKGNGGKPGTDADGAIQGQITVDVAVKKNKTHKVTMSEDDFPPMGETDNVLRVDDVTNPQPVTYTADQDFARYSVTNSQGTKVAILVNPDGTYSVGGQNAATVGAAADAIRTSGVLKGVSVEHMGALYARLIRRQQATATLIGLNGGDDEPNGLVKELIRQMQAGKAF